jgi:TRAP-type transport system small permease protein
MEELGDIGARYRRGPLDRACARIEWVTVRAAALALVLTVLLTTADALARYFLNSPIAGAIEINNEFLMPALVFFTMSYVYSKGGHVRVTIVSEHLPPRVQRALMGVFDFLTALIFAGLTYGLVLRTIDSYAMREYSASPLGYLLAPSYAIVAIGGALMTVRAFVAAVTLSHPRVADAADLEAY